MKGFESEIERETVSESHTRRLDPWPGLCHVSFSPSVEERDSLILSFPSNSNHIVNLKDKLILR